MVPWKSRLGFVNVVHVDAVSGAARLLRNLKIRDQDMLESILEGDRLLLGDSMLLMHAQMSTGFGVLALDLGTGRAEALFQSVRATRVRDRVLLQDVERGRESMRVLLKSLDPDTLAVTQLEPIDLEGVNQVSLLRGIPGQELAFLLAQAMDPAGEKSLQVVILNSQYQLERRLHLQSNFGGSGKKWLNALSASTAFGPNVNSLLMLFAPSAEITPEAFGLLVVDLTNGTSTLRPLELPAPPQKSWDRKVKYLVKASISPDGRSMAVWTGLERKSRNTAEGHLEWTALALIDLTEETPTVRTIGE